MKLRWIKFYGSYGDVEFVLGRDGVTDMFIERYSSEPFCGRSQLYVAMDSGTEKVRSLDGVNYDFKKV
jgi:hypothetical protein